jgi:uncharacterized protein YndB with AHSA1/START domain
MMRFLAYGLGAVVLALSGLLAWGLAMDSKWRVERSVEIAEAPGPVFAYVSILRNWPEWTAWGAESYPNLRYSYEGPDWGVGATQRWQDNGMKGEMRVRDFQPGEYLEYELSMEPGNIHLRGSLRIKASAGGSVLTWSCWGDAGGNPIDKIKTLFYGPMIGRDFSAGLAKLQARFD